MKSNLDDVYAYLKAKQVLNITEGKKHNKTSSLQPC